MLKWLLPQISPKSLMVRREGYAFLLRPGNFEINQSEFTKEVGGLYRGRKLVIFLAKRLRGSWSSIYQRLKWI
jgi:hypothetical protein